MDYQLLLVDGQGAVNVSQLRIRTLREFPGNGSASIHFHPVRNDVLFESAKFGGGLAYRILSGEGIVRGQSWVEFEVPGEHRNVIGRSSDLLFALALITAAWKQPGEARSIAATGALDAEGAVLSVERTVEKVAAAVRDLQSSPQAIIFFPAADGAAIESWRVGQTIPAHVALRPVAHLDEALGHLGYTLDKVYLRNPFRGLEHFDYEHHSIFFGRDREVREVLDQLLRREAAGVPGLLVEGPSGSGKSSFLRAGVLPALVQPRSQPEATRDRIGARPLSQGSGRAVWRPGLMAAAVDEAGMVQSIRECWRAFPELQGSWGDGVGTLAELAQKRREHWPANRRCVWMIDQFEEIFALRMDTALIDALGNFLQQLQADGVWTLAAVRADAMPQIKDRDTLRAVFGANEGQYYLSSLRGAALDDVIARPARAGDLKFEGGADGKSLEQVLRDEAYLEQDSLPQLQFTLNELYLRRSGNELTFAAYRELGGLSGSLEKAAEAVLKSDEPDGQSAVPRVFRSLVSVDDSGRATRRYAPLAEIAQDPLQKRLVLRLVDARLCVTDERDGEAVVAFAHDSLLRTLPALTAWLKAEAGLLQMRELAQRETRLWQQHGEVDSWLATADKLAQLRMLESAEVPLPPPVREFMERSARRVRRARSIRRGAIAAIAVLAMAASAGAWIAIKKQREAENQTAQTREAQARLVTEFGSNLVNNGETDMAQALVAEIVTGHNGPVLESAAAVNVFQEARATDFQVEALIGHADRVRSAAFSPDGKRIVTASWDDTARIWDVATGSQILQVAHKDRISTATYSPDGKKIVTASTDGTARIWDAVTGAELLVLSGHAGRVTSADYSPDGKRIVTTSVDKTARIWDANTGQSLVSMKGHTEPVYLARFSPDGKRVVTASFDTTARIWDAMTGRELLKLTGHTRQVLTASFSFDGGRVVTAGFDWTTRIWDSTTGRQLVLIQQNERPDIVLSAAFSPDGKQVVNSTASTVRVWDASTGRQLQVMNGHAGLVFSVGYSPDGSQIVSGSDDTTARVWDVAGVRESRVLNGQEDAGTAVYSTDGSRIVTASHDATARIWDAATGRQLQVLSGHDGSVRGAAFSNDGTKVVTAGDDRTARIWDATTGRQLLMITGHERDVYSAGFSPDAGRVVTGSGDKTARIWDAATGRELLRLTGHTERVSFAAFSPDGKTVATSSDDSTVRIWDSSTGRQLRTLSGHERQVYEVEFSPDGRQIVSASADRTARIWDVVSGAELARLEHPVNLESAAFSWDGKRIVTTSGDGTVRIWDVATLRPLRMVGGGGESFTGSSFSPDGTHVVTTSQGGPSRIWDAHVEPLHVQFEHAEAAEVDPLTSEQRFRYGLPEEQGLRTWPDDHNECDDAAAAPYDPERRAAGAMLASLVADVATAACAKDKSARGVYQHGRALLVGGDLAGARRNFEASLESGYVVARVDLAILFSQPSDLTDAARAISLHERAWKDGIPFAGFRLGDLYEHGIADAKKNIVLPPDEKQAWAWYQRAADAGEPHALARFGGRASASALAAVTEPARLTAMLEAFRYYAAATEIARTQGWPDGAWSPWRYRRASLARLLGRAGKMRDVAELFERVHREQASQTTR